MIIIFDTETTGLIKPDANSLDAQPYITEIFCAKFNDDMETPIVGDSFYHSLVKPPIPLSAEISRITSITNEMVADAPSFAEIYQSLAKFFRGTREMVAHNLAFDRSMLANELLRIDKVLNFPWAYQHTCTVEKSMYLEGRRLNLTKLHEYATGQAEIPNAHRAGGDVAALVKCYQWLKKKGKT